MHYTESDQALMLCCAHLAGAAGPHPLATAEWDALARFLMAARKTPADLLDAAFVASLPDAIAAEGSASRTILKARIEALLSRGLALGVTLASWEERGIWVATRASTLFPAALRRTLGRSSPPLFYTAGSPELLQGDAIGIVGSRDAAPEALAWAEAFGAEAARAGVTVVSGCARGIDRAGMTGALQAGGRAVGFVADSLMRAVLRPENRRFIASGRLALLTPFGPEAPFSRGTAMGRNHFIYAATQGVCVVASAETGGTATGAREALVNGWGRVFVRDRSMPGLRALAALGAGTVPDDPEAAFEAIRAGEA